MKPSAEWLLAELNNIREAAEKFISEYEYQDREMYGDDDAVVAFRAVLYKVKS